MPSILKLVLTGCRSMFSWDRSIKKLEDKIMNNGGAALIIDYGYVYPSHKSTLQSVKQHKYANFLENVGNSDITALVNFQALRDSLRYVDCEILTQENFYIFLV